MPTCWTSSAPWTLRLAAVALYHRVVPFPYPSLCVCVCAQGHGVLEMPSGTGKTVSLLALIVAYLLVGVSISSDDLYHTRTL